MTIEFTKEQWLPLSDKFQIFHQFQQPFDGKPIIQVYFYPDKSQNPFAVLTDISQVSYSDLGNTLNLLSTNPFDGYIVVR
ncbi:hypothetical protein [Chryseobacterium vrystaatense]|nr:hypothetical protein [Chryseobacterium vrystaatense]